MKVYEKKIIPRRTETYLKLRKCDLCDATSTSETWGSGAFYKVNETEISIEIRQEEGSSYPEGGNGKKYEVDLCPSCFKDKLIPWLNSQNANIKQEEWDWC
jgi:hypothetical protein